MLGSIRIFRIYPRGWHAKFVDPDCGRDRGLRGEPGGRAETGPNVGFTPEKRVVVTHTLKPFIKAVNAEVGDEITLKGYWGGSPERNSKK